MTLMGLEMRSGFGTTRRDDDDNDDDDDDDETRVKDEFHDHHFFLKNCRRWRRLIDKKIEL